MRIAMLSNAAVVHTTRWAGHFRACGHEVGVWSLETPAPRFDAVHVRPAPLPGVLRYPLAAPRIARELARFAPDLVDAHYVPNYGLIGALSGRRPLSVSAWGSDLLVAGRRDFAQRARARFVLRRADLVIADSGNLAAAAHALGAPLSRLRTIPWGVDRAGFPPARERQRGLLLSTRMHEDVYDIPVILRAVAELMRERPDLELVVAGEGSRRATHERLARECLPAGRWRFTGRIEPAELAGLLARAEIALSASHSDSTSLSLLEAMSAGAIPVVSDIDGNREWVGDGDGARLFAVGDASAAAAALRSALADPAWAARARERNASVIALRGDWHVNMAQVEAAFRALVERRALPAAGAWSP